MNKQSLLIPVNPEYTFDISPEEQASYVNPLALNDRLIYYANTCATIVYKLNEYRKKLVDAKVEVRKIARQVSDFEDDLMLEASKTKADFKNLKDRAFALKKLAKDLERLDQYVQLLDTQDAASEMVLRLEVSIENCSDMLHMVQQLSSNIQTHLSYVKSEMAMNRGAHKYA